MPFSLPRGSCGGREARSVYVAGSIINLLRRMKTMKSSLCVRAVLCGVLPVGGLLFPLEATAWKVTEEQQEIAMKLQPDLENGLEIYILCADCHEPEGWGSRNGEYPMIAGQHRNVLIKQLADIRDGNREDEAMYDFAQDEEIGGKQAIADVTAYIQTLPMNPRPGLGKGDDLERGARVYEDRCGVCHSSDGAGHGDWAIPWVAGQHYRYLRRQLDWMLDGRRRNANEEMMVELREMNPADIKAVSDYMSRMKVDPELVADSPDWTNPDFE